MAKFLSLNQNCPIKILISTLKTTKIEKFQLICSTIRLGSSVTLIAAVLSYSLSDDNIFYLFRFLLLLLFDLAVFAVFELVFRLPYPD